MVLSGSQHRKARVDVDVRPEGGPFLIRPFDPLRRSVQVAQPAVHQRHVRRRHVAIGPRCLEPGHDLAVREAAGLARAEGRASVACPLTKRWGRTLDDEYKSGACHGGSYETSIVMASAPDRVDDEARRRLPEVPVSMIG